MLIRIKQGALLISDAISMYCALFFTLLIRYDLASIEKTWGDHIGPFSAIFLIWIIVFYIGDLYRSSSFNFNTQTFQTFLVTVGIGGAIAMMLFYLFGPFFELTPKTNLLLVIALSGAIGSMFRLGLSRLYIARGGRNRVLFIGDPPIIFEISSHLTTHPHLGYDVISHFKTTDGDDVFSFVEKERVATVVVQPSLEQDPKLIRLMYRLLSKEVVVLDLISFYETIFQKIPVSELEERWFIENIPIRRKFYDALKRVSDVVLSLFFLAIFIAPMILIAIAICVTSKGSAIYKQERIGKSEEPFTLYKFRTMKIHQQGPLWTVQNDVRLTPIGKFLRFTHLDELPQLFNILRGDISFVGPRPERKELVEQYKKLPHYDIRHIIKPGLTGWPQISFRPSASIEEALKKLEYDVYYIKNRSIGLDILIALRTAKMLVFNHE